MDMKLEASLVAEYPALVERAKVVGGTIELYRGDLGTGWVAPNVNRFDPEKRIQAFAEHMARRLSERLPGEKFELLESDLRPLADGLATNSQPHVDGRYLTMTYSFFGPGTVIYAPDLRAREVQPLVAPARTVTVISNRDRELVLGRPVSTVHSAPPGRLARRLLLLMRFWAREAVAAAKASLPPGASPDLSRLAAVRAALGDR
jgi:hypothetical protein